MKHTINREDTTMKTRRVEYVALGRLSDVPEPELCLTKQGPSLFSEVQVIRFASRLALETFNKKAGLRPLVYTEVPKGHAIWKHEREVA
jgi:hypothetical protein